MEEGSVPVGAKIISVFYYIGAVFGILAGIMFLIGAGLIASVAEQLFPGFGVLGSSISLIVGIVILVFAILNFFIGRGLWKGRNWARIVVIIFSVTGLLGGIFYIVQGNLLNGIVSTFISGLIAGYLLFSKSVKEAFSKTQQQPLQPQQPLQ